MCRCSNCMFVLASLFLTMTFLAVGISFFGPFWMSNIGKAVNETQKADPQGESYLVGENPTWMYPDRGLWAQCGPACIWFWSDNFRLQDRLFTPLKWHLATQVLYTVAAVIILAAEIVARIQLCCHEDRQPYTYSALGVMILVSALLQTAAVAVFGAEAAQPPYNAISDPKEFSEYLGQAFDPSSNPVSHPYLGWCFWMAVVGSMFSVVSGILFLLAACRCCEDDDDK